MAISAFKESQSPVMGMVVGGINMVMVTLFAFS